MDSHGVDAALMEEVKRFVYAHYDEHLKDTFYASDLAKGLQLPAEESKTISDQVDWETAYFIRHRPTDNVADFPEIPPATRLVFFDCTPCSLLTVAFLLTFVSCSGRCSTCTSARWCRSQSSWPSA